MSSSVIFRKGLHPSRFAFPRNVFTVLAIPFLGFFFKTASADTLTWAATNSTAWNPSTGNWTGDTTVYTDGDNVVFGDPVPQSGTVAVSLGGINPGQVQVLNNSGTYTISGGPIGGSGPLLKSGNGTLILGSSNTYFGGTAVTGGTLVVEAGDIALGDPSGALTLDGGILSIQGAALVSSRNFNINAGGGSIDTGGLGSSTSGPVSGPGLLTKTGLGDFSISGAVGTASQSTGISVSAGSLTLTGANTEYVTMPSTPSDFGGDLNIDGGVSLIVTGATDFSNPALINGGGKVNILGSGASILVSGSGPGAVEIDNNIALNSQSLSESFSTSFGAGASSQLAIDGTLSGDSDVHFIYQSFRDSPLILLNAAATYTGATYLDYARGGVLRIGVDNALPVTTQLDFGSGALDLNGYDQTVSALSAQASASINGITNTGTTTSTLTVNQNVDTTYASDIGTLANLGSNLVPQGADLNNINLVKTGTGALQLLGNETYSGSTTVSAGTLVVNGGISGSPGSGGITQTSGVSVTNGATLAGHGVVTVAPGGNVVIGSGATLSPGDNFPSDYPTGVLTVSVSGSSPSTSGTFNLQSGGTLYISLEAAVAGGSQNPTNSGPGFDSQLAVQGNITLAGNLAGTLLNGFTANVGDLFFIIINQGTNPINGTFAGNPSMITLTGPGGTEMFNIGYNGDSAANSFTGGNDVVLQMTDIPEPATTGMCLASVGLLFLRETYRRRR